MEGYRADTYGEAFADVYDDWYGSLGDVDAVVGAVSAAAREAGGAILELGVGTGRLALPLARLGHEVVGIDSSETMLERLAAKADSTLLELHRLDMTDLAALPEPGRFGVVFAAFNTLLNLPSAQDRRRCMSAIGPLLAPEGVVAIEAVVPGPEPPAVSDHVEIATLTTDRLVLTVSRRDPVERTVSGHHVELTDGAPIRLRPWKLSYLSPDELDREAADCGLEMVERTAGWDRSPFGETATSHVTWYRAAPAGTSQPLKDRTIGRPHQGLSR